MRTIMKTFEKFPAITEAIASKNAHLFNQKAYDRITDAIWWAWGNWDKNVLTTYYTGEKPEEPTYEFRRQWVENELENLSENWNDVIESFKG